MTYAIRSFCLIVYLTSFLAAYPVLRVSIPEGLVEMSFSLGLVPFLLYMRDDTKGIQHFLILFLITIVFVWFVNPEW